MDKALELKIRIDRGDTVSKSTALHLLAQSELVENLTRNWSEEPLFAVWRIIALSEIPFAKYLDYTCRLVDRVFDNMATPMGFSLSGDEKQFLPCYNAMLISALCRLGQAKSDSVMSGVEWIATHQPMERGVSVSIPDLRFDRFGGCFNNTPCYIGVAKSVFALSAFQKATSDTSILLKLEQGKEYLLQHQLVRRHSNGSPITRHILDISFPESYHLNIVELIRFAGNSGLLNDPRCQFAIDYLQSKKGATGWRRSFHYRANGYVAFDKSGRKSGDWVTYLIQQSLKGKPC